jgi:hypothetical protein
MVRVDFGEVLKMTQNYSQIEIHIRCALSNKQEVDK